MLLQFEKFDKFSNSFDIAMLALGVRTALSKQLTSSCRAVGLHTEPQSGRTPHLALSSESDAGRPRHHKQAGAHRCHPHCLSRPSLHRCLHGSGVWHDSSGQRGRQQRGQSDRGVEQHSFLLSDQTQLMSPPVGEFGRGRLKWGKIFWVTCLQHTFDRVKSRESRGWRREREKCWTTELRRKLSRKWEWNKTEVSCSLGLKERSALTSS